MVYRASMTLEVVSPCLPMRAWPAAHRVWRMHQVSTQAPRCTCRWFTHAHRRAHTHTHTHTPAHVVIVPSGLPYPSPVSSFLD